MWGLGEYLNANDFYPDVRPCLERLREAGYFVGIAGNQTSRAGAFIRELNLPADVVATSDDWGVTKPSPGFFARVIDVSGHEPGEIMYVGDRLDNDIAPAIAAGLRTASVRRGPWGFILIPRSPAPAGPVTTSPNWTVHSLDELADLILSESVVTCRKLPHA